jgi:hypothetical protein
MQDALLPRPTLGRGLPVADFDAWEWRKDELITFARALGVPTRGTKEALSRRIRSQLGRVYPPTETVITADGVVTPPALKVVAPVSASMPRPAAPAPDTANVEAERPVSTSPSGIFSPAPGESRAVALAAWFARRNSRAG